MTNEDGNMMRSDGDKDVLLHSQVAYAVHAAEDEEGVDWSIESHGNDKIMAITLYKATPMAGVTLWWKRPLAEMEEISMDWREQTTSSGFQNVWNEAHAQFADQKRRDALETQGDEE